MAKDMVYKTQGPGEPFRFNARVAAVFPDMLQRSIPAEDGATRASLLASEPLTDEPWQRLAPGSLHVYRAGERIGGRSDPLPGAAAFASNDAPIEPTRYAARRSASTAQRVKQQAW